MVPKLHAKGTSFRGLAAYLLHDADRAKTSHRVAWAITRNLATDEPDVAWRVMAATALYAPHLKAQAGIKNTGRKSQDVVLHVTLAWHPDERLLVSPAEMQRAALGAIEALGAQEHQALIVGHDDRKHAHVHIMINRVSPDDGRMLSSSKEKLNLSRWAEDYERDRGRIFCEQRVENNAARRRGAFTRGRANRPRHLYELEAANQNHPAREAVRKDERGKDATIAKQGRQLDQSHRAKLRDLDRLHRQRLAAIRGQALIKSAQAKAAVKDAFLPRWAAMLRDQELARAQFEHCEAAFLGRVANAFRTIERTKETRSREPGSALRETFKAFTSAGRRLAALLQFHERAAKRLLREQRAAERAAIGEITKQRDLELRVEREAFTKERTSLLATQQREKAAMRAAWEARREERAAAYEQESRAQEREVDPMQEFAERIRRQLGRPPNEHDRGHDRSR